jgi:hypothetical protein
MTEALAMDGAIGGGSEDGPIGARRSAGNALHPGAKKGE